MTDVSLEEVEGQIAGGSAWPRFTPTIEVMFRRDYVAERVRLAGTFGVIGVLVYNLVHFADRAMLGDVAKELFLLRFTVFTPFVIVCIWAIRRRPPPASTISSPS